MKAPVTYSDWAVVLERFGQGDDMVIDDMNAGSFVLDAGTAKRFYARVEEVYKKRKQKWLDKFQRSFQMQKMHHEDDFGIILRDGKQNLLPLSKFIAAKGLPEDLRTTLQKDLSGFVEEIKKSLRDNISKTDNNREKMLLMLASFGLAENPPGMPVELGRKSPSNEDTVSPAGRKIIF